MKDNIMLVGNKNAYFYYCEDQCQFCIQKTFVAKAINVFCKRLKLSYPIFIINKEILKCDKLIITDSAFNYSLYLFLIKKINIKNIILYYLNPINENNRYMMNYFNNVYTFDIKDSKKYNIKFMHTPYSEKIVLTNSELENDTLFLGRAKDRVDEIINLKYLLDNLELKNKFLVLDTNIEEIKINKFISYQNYLQLVSKSKCLIELNQDIQSGCSLRFMESLFLHKKLITNNIYIVNDPYYNMNNVYILNNDDRNLKEFINTPYIDDGKSLNELVFENWIGEF